MLLSGMEALRMLAQAPMRKFTAADCDAFPEFSGDDDELALIGEHQGYQIVLDGNWLMAYRTDDNRTLAFMGVVLAHAL